MVESRAQHIFRGDCIIAKQQHYLEENETSESERLPSSGGISGTSRELHLLRALRH